MGLSMTGSFLVVFVYLCKSPEFVGLFVFCVYHVKIYLPDFL